MAQPKRHKDVPPGACFGRPLRQRDNSKAENPTNVRMLESFVNSRHFIVLSRKIRHF